MNKKRILITGAKGQLGRSLSQSNMENLNRFDLIETDIDSLNLTNNDEIEKTLKKFSPDYLINCAAYTAVDLAEDNPKIAESLNKDVPGVIGKYCSLFNVVPIHISTDYVFSGNQTAPYTEDAHKDALSVYGKTKAAGEEEILNNSKEAIVLRTAWLYSEFGKNFLKTMLRLGAERDELSVVADQTGTPTYAGDLSALIFRIIEAHQQGRFAPGIYHTTNKGQCSWYDFALKIMEVSRTDCKISKIKTTEYPTKAKRPMFSVLCNNKIEQVLGYSMPSWQKGLERCMMRIKLNEIY